MCIIDTLLHFVIGCFNSLNLNLIRNLSIILIVKSMNTSIMWPCCYYLYSIICAPTVSTRDDCVSFPTYLLFSQRYQHSIFYFEIFIHRIVIFLIYTYILLLCLYLFNPCHFHLWGYNNDSCLSKTNFVCFYSFYSHIVISPTWFIPIFHITIAQES